MSIKLPVNLENVQRTSVDEIPPGYYLVEIMGYKLIKTKKNLDDAIVVRFKVKQAGIGREKFVNCEVEDIFVISEKTMWKIANFLDAVYGTTVKGDDFPEPERLAGKEVIVVMKPDSYKGVGVGGYFNKLKWEVYKDAEPIIQQNQRKISNNLNGAEEMEYVEEEDVPF